MAGPTNPANPPMSQFDGLQTLRKGFDDTTDAYREEVSSLPLPANAAQEANGNISQINEMLLRIFQELRCIRMACASMATQGGMAESDDFNPLVQDFDETR